MTGSAPTDYTAPPGALSAAAYVAAAATATATATATAVAIQEQNQQQMNINMHMNMNNQYGPGMQVFNIEEFHSFIDDKIKLDRK